MRFMMYSLIAGLLFVSLPATAEDGEFGASMFTNEAPAALGEEPDTLLSEEATLLDSIEPAAGEPSVLDDGWLPATTEEKRLALPDDPVVPGMDMDAAAE